MAEILITKPGALGQRDRAALRRAGIIVVEAENPADVKLIAASGAEVSAGSMLFAALQAIDSDRFSGNTRQAFVRGLVATMEAAHPAINPEAGG